MGGYIYIPIPIPSWKFRVLPIPIPIPSQSGDSPSKRGRIRVISTDTGLFAISIWNWTFDGLSSNNIFSRHFIYLYLFFSYTDYKLYRHYSFKVSVLFLTHIGASWMCHCSTQLPQNLKQITITFNFKILFNYWRIIFDS